MHEQGSQSGQETAPLGFNAEGWPLPEVRSMMIDNFVRSWLRHWFAVIVLFVTSFSLIMFSSWLVTPRWEGRTDAMILTQPLPNLGLTEEGNTPAGIIDEGTMAANIIELAKSRVLLTKVVEELELDKYFAEKTRKPSRRDKIKIAIGNVLTLRFLRGGGGGGGDPKIKAVEELSKNWITVAPLEKTSLIPLSVFGDDPDITVAVGNKVMELVEREMNQLLLDQIQSRVDWLQTEVNSLRTIVETKEDEIIDYRSSLTFIDPVRFSESTMDVLADLNSERATLELEINSASAIVARADEELTGLQQFRTREVATTGTSEAAAERPSQRLRLDLADLRGEREQLLARHPASSPVIQALDARIRSMSEDLTRVEEIEASQSQSLTESEEMDPEYRDVMTRRREAANNRVALISRLGGLEESISKLREMQREAIRAEGQLDRLNRDARRISERYNRAVDRLTTFQSMLGQHDGELPEVFKSMIVSAECTVLNPNKPDHPSGLLALIAAAGVATFTCLVMPVAYDYLRQTMLSSRQTAAIPGIRIVAVVPKLSRRKMYQPAGT